MDFHGNWNEVAAAFHYRIYDAALLERIRTAAAPVVERSRGRERGGSSIILIDADMEEANPKYG